MSSEDDKFIATLMMSDDLEPFIALKAKVTVSDDLIKITSLNIQFSHFNRIIDAYKNNRRLFLGVVRYREPDLMYHITGKLKDFEIIGPLSSAIKARFTLEIQDTDII